MDGIINIYKERGFTSHDVVAKLRGILKQKKIGHTGTLDPDAEGVLPVCLGNATKMCDLLTEKEKTYEAVLLLGKETDTQDISGTIINEKEVVISEQEVISCIEDFVGIYDQVPPMYSALKVNGKKLYELAREGKVIERTARRVEIISINIIEVNLPRVRFSVQCSKGTYIRTLCHDIGMKLGCYGCMESLLRTKSGIFTIDHALKLREVEHRCANSTLMESIIQVPELFPTYPKVFVKPEFDKLVLNGNPLSENHFTQDNIEINLKNQLLVYNSNKSFVGIYEWKQEKHQFFPVKMFL